MKFLILCLLIFLTPVQVVATPVRAESRPAPERQVIRASEVTLAPYPAPIKEPPSFPKTHTLLRADVTVSPETLTQYLESKNSPLAPYSALILESPYWSTIIGICSIEQYGCSRAPYWNYWGLMKSSGGLQQFGSAEEGIAAISAYLEKQVSRGRDTLESFRGFYCVNRAYPGNVCPSWESTVKKIKSEVEHATDNTNPNTNNY